MRCDHSVIGFSHPSDNPAFGDSTGMAEIRLQYAGGTLFKDFAKAPFGKYPFSCRDGQVCPALYVHEHIYILCLARFFNEHRLVRLELFNKYLRRLGWYGTVKVDPDVHGLATGFS